MNIAFDPNTNLVPAIVQDEHTQKVLMLGYMNAEALRKTQDTGWVTFYSRSRKEIWVKGATSGNRLQLVSIEADCDSDALLVRAIPQGPTCHTGAYSCFGENDGQGFLRKLEATIQARKANPSPDSYTSQLLTEGINRVAQKVGEEAVELIIEAKDDNRSEFEGEAADLLYHFLVLLAAKDASLKDIERLLASRHGGQ